MMIGSLDPIRRRRVGPAGWGDGASVEAITDRAVDYAMGGGWPERMAALDATLDAGPRTRGQGFATIADPWGPGTVPPRRSEAPLDPTMLAQTASLVGSRPMAPTTMENATRSPLNAADFVAGPGGLRRTVAESGADMLQGLGASMDWMGRVPWDLGGGAFNRSMGNLATKMGPGVASGMVRGLGAAGRVGIPLLGWGAVAAGPVMSGLSGAEQAGVGGAAIKGGLSGGGALAGGLIGTALGGPVGALVGSSIGGFLGDQVGGAATGFAQKAVDDLNVDGPLAPLGRIAAGLGVESSDEKLFRDQQRAVYQAQNSPAMRMIKEEQKQREEKERSRAIESMLYATLARGAF